MPAILALRTRGLLLCIAIAAPLWVPAAGRAQDTVVELLKDANQALVQRDYPRARALFRRAHQERESAQSGFGLAVTAFELDDHPEAVRQGRAAMLSQVDPLSAEQRGRAREIVEQSLRRVGQLYVTLSPPDAELAVDGEPVVVRDGAILLLEAGTHRLDALADGYLPASESVELSAGQRRNVKVRLEPTPDADFGFAQDAQAAEDDGDFPLVPVILVSVGGAMLIAGGITGLLAVGDEGELEERCGAAPDFCPDRYQGLADSAEDLALATNVLWVAGSLVAAVGTTWLVLELSEDEDSSQAALELGPRHAGLRLSGHF